MLYYLNVHGSNVGAKQNCNKLFIPGNKNRGYFHVFQNEKKSGEKNIEKNYGITSSFLDKSNVVRICLVSMM